MSQIPYGYRIVRGKAEIHQEEAERVRKLAQYYLAGLSITEAGSTAEIPMCRASCGKILSNRVYLGTEYYPQIMDQSMYDAIQEERSFRVRKRKNDTALQQGEAEPEAPLLFSMKEAEENRIEEADTPEELAAYLYSLIRADENGSNKIIIRDKKLLKMVWTKKGAENGNQSHTCEAGCENQDRICPGNNQGSSLLQSLNRPDGTGKFL